MKASDAKILVSKHKQLKETLTHELKTIYSEIHSSAVDGMSAWIDEIDDIDSFLEELIEVNEKCTSSPSLEEFCASFSLNTTEVG